MQAYFRDAVPSDIPAIAAILRSASHLSDLEHREQLGSYRDALIEIDRTDGNYLLVAEYDRQITALIQLLAFRHIHHGGGRTAQIVAMHVAEPFRTTGINGMLLDHAAERARDLGCRRLQVLSSTARTDDHPFWERNGFVQLDRGYVRTLV
jgi:GNAT superfamily N-acetyltransferase